MKGSRNEKQQGMSMKRDGLGHMQMIGAVMNQMRGKREYFRTPKAKYQSSRPY
jgi:hypothetical protein